VHVWSPYPLTVQRERFGRTVHDRQMVGCLGQPLGPPAGASSQFQDIAPSSEGVQGGIEYPHLMLPLDELLFPSVIVTASLPPLVVFRSPSPVERLLLGQKGVFIHNHSIAPSFSQGSGWPLRAGGRGQGYLALQASIKNRLACAT
jgi:hypothetical protein